MSDFMSGKHPEHSKGASSVGLKEAMTVKSNITKSILGDGESLYASLCQRLTRKKK